MASTMAEIVYGTKEEGHVMSDKVSQLAASVYTEFEKMIKKYDEDVVKELMPLVVGILETLDQSYREKQEAEVDQELLREDNEQLLTQYEREKQLRKGAEQKYLEMEDVTEEERKATEEKTDSLESIVRMLELKNKNSADHLSRMEEKESEMKKEYNKIHERYTELMRTHMDYMERAKILMGTDRISDMANSPRSRKMSTYLADRSMQTSPLDLGVFHLPNLKPVNIMSMSGSTPLKSTGSPPDASSFDMMSPRSGKDSNISIKSEMSDLESPADVNSNPPPRRVVVQTTTRDKEQNTDRVDVREFATATKTREEKAEHPVAAPGSPSVVVVSEAGVQPVPDTAQPVALTASGKRTDSSTGDDSVFTDSKVAVTVTVDSEPSQAQPKSEPSVTNSDSVEVKSESSVIGKSVDNVESVRQEEYVMVEKDIPADKSAEVSQKKSKKTVKKKKSVEVECETRDLPSPVSPVSPGHGLQFDYEDEGLTGLDQTLAHIVATTPELEAMEESVESNGSISRDTRRNDTSIFDELAIQDPDLGSDFGITDSEDEQERNSNVSDNFFGMGKELENLILENTELLATKNALNIVKDDLIAKVDELSSEQEILREEINSLQAVKTKLQQRIKELEDDLKKSKEELEKKNQAAQEQENEDDVPMAQRKRFTRVEMARVLMERNQYKERLMELQEAVRWTEMIRASREHPEITPSKKKSSIWNFFSNLFNSPNSKPSKKPLPMAMVKYNAPTTNVQPVGDPNQRQRGKYNLGDKAKAYDFLQDDLSESLGEPIVSQPNTSEKAKKEREKERKEQYKQVRAHVKKDDGRMQAYGWSLPAKFQPQIPSAAPAKSSVPVPVPIYCRPLLEKEQGLKIWCAAGVNLTGGKTKDGGSIVGASVFYSNPPETETKKKELASDVDKLAQELHDHEQDRTQSEKEKLSSFVWICTSTHTQSRASVIDANNPGDILETFRVSTTPVLCIASVPGALESDYPVDEDILKAESYPQHPSTDPEAATPNSSSPEESGIGGISFVQCATGVSTGGGSNPTSPVGSPAADGTLDPDKATITAAVAEAFSNRGDGPVSSRESRDSIGSVPTRHRDSLDSIGLDRRNSVDAIGDSVADTKHKHKRGSRASLDSMGAAGEVTHPMVFKAKGSPVSSGTSTPVKSESSERRLLKEPSELVKDGISSVPSGSNLQDEEVEKLSSVLPTMWLGAQSGSLYVHSSVSQWKRCLHSVKLRDSILNIVHVKGRVLVALADGTVAIFHRATDGQWDLQNYHLLDLGRPHHSIRCMSVIANKHVWCGYRNKIHVVDPKSMSIEKSFDAHPRKESQVRQLAWLGDGVWVSIRLDSTLRLYHAYTHQHLQDVDIEPYVSKMLGTGKLGFSFVRITSMLISCTRLWIGTGNGVIISVPLTENNKQTVSMGASGGRPGGIVRVYSDTKTDSVTPGSFIPYCTMAQAQLSFHGHRDAVKFFVAVPGDKRKGMSAASQESADASPVSMETKDSTSGTKLVLSGGEGYVDFRIGDGDDEIIVDAEEEEKKPSLSKGDRSHLIVWEVSNPE